MNIDLKTAGCYAPCACANVLCAQYGCQKQMAGVGQNNWAYTPPPRGCICPPGANKECENQYCPRKPYPVSAFVEVKK